MRSSKNGTTVTEIGVSDDLMAVACLVPGSARLLWQYINLRHTAPGQEGILNQCFISSLLWFLLTLQ